ncbi:MAG: hypothetical protein Q7U04_18225 [Bacteriovorax sp.]|nr:hypothetical protein [Bacteriovorax sp.]
MIQDTRCVNCGLNIEKDYILLINGQEFTFDSFECAVNFVAPRCKHCNAIIINSGVEMDGEIFCNSQCSSEKNHTPIMA